METTTGPEAAIYAAMLGVLFGLYKGDRAWGRTLLWSAVVVLIGLLLLYAPELFPEYF